MIFMRCDKTATISYEYHGIKKLEFDWLINLENVTVGSF